MDTFFVELSTADDVVRFEGEGDLDCLCIAKGSIEGWWSTPTPKVIVTSRGQGDGGHDIHLLRQPHRHPALECQRFRQAVLAGFD